MLAYSPTMFSDLCVFSVVPSKAILCVTASKKYVASCGEDFTCCVYEDLKKLKSSRHSNPMKVLKGHVAPVSAVTFSPDETMVATGILTEHEVLYLNLK